MKVKVLIRPHSKTNYVYQHPPLYTHIPKTLMETEVYTIDSNGTFVIFGGNKQVLNVGYAGKLSQSDNFYDDSIIYTKFFDNYHFYLVTMNGRMEVIRLVESGDTDVECVDDSCAQIVQPCNKDEEEREIGHNDEQERKINNEDEPEREIGHMNEHEGVIGHIDEHEGAIGHIDEHEREINNKDQRYILTVEERRCLQKDISFVTHHKNILLIGCTDGEIHLFYKNLQHHINLAGHKSEITALSILNNYVFSCSAQNFIVYKNNSVVHNHKTNELKGMHVIDDRIYLMYNHCIRVLKHDACFSTSYNEKEYDAYFGDNTAYYGSESFSSVYDISSNATECIAKINNDLVIGGEYLMVMVKGREHRTAVQHVNLLVVSHTIVVFATLDGQIGIGDYREEQFSMCDGDVGLVYDMVLCDNVVYVAGENGTNEILLEDCGAPQL